MCKNAPEAMGVLNLGQEGGGGGNVRNSQLEKQILS